MWELTWLVINKKEVRYVSPEASHSFDQTPIFAVCRSRVVNSVPCVEVHAQKWCVTNELVREDQKQEQTRRGRKKKLKIGNPHLGMVAKKADGIV